MVCLANLVRGSTIPSIFIMLGMACFERNDAVITVCGGSFGDSEVLQMIIFIIVK